MSASSDTWSAAPRPNAPFLRLLEDAVDRTPRTPVPILGGRVALLTREAGAPPVERWVGQQSFGAALSRRVRVRCVPVGAPESELWRAALLDEAAALAALEHPNVVQLVDVVEDEHRLGVVREHVDGVPLSAVLRVCQGAGVGIPFDLAVHLASEISWVLDALHQATDGQGRSLGLVHRGLHPDHVRITRGGHVKLDGFELARMHRAGRQATAQGVVKGFAAYLPPEVIAGEPAGPAADQYAVGVMLFELLTGEPCFTGANAADLLWKVVRDGPPLARLESHRVPPELREVVARATTPSPEDRFEGAGRMARALDEYAELIRRHGRPWRVASFLAAQGHFPSPATERPAAGLGLGPREASTKVVSREVAPEQAALPSVPGVRVSSGLAGGVEITEVEDRVALWRAEPRVEVAAASPAVDVSDLGVEEEPMLLEDDDVVLITLE
jgi:hypothetical protein